MPTVNETNKPILVAFADDHELIRVTMIPYLETNDEFQPVKVILTASNGVELISAIKSSPQKPHVCILDIKMPEMDGFSTVREIRETWPNMKVLILTAYSRSTFIIRMIFAGVHGYISKNSHPQTIREAVIEVQRTGIYCNDLISQKEIRSLQTHKEKEFVPKLSEAELELLKYCIEDRTYKEIAVLMKTTAKSIEGHRNKLFQKLGAKSRTGLVMYAVVNGYVDLEDHNYQKLFKIQ
ncbi:response regulator transcription factor [Rurimicrobium arvi]|uniref:Response regulator transcription factor n=1 Tax=Rurimicrobium arvi TaxID=2049916 RepID=A0ABP8MYD2_9BACT